MKGPVRRLAWLRRSLLGPLAWIGCWSSTAGAQGMAGRMSAEPTAPRLASVLAFTRVTVVDVQMGQLVPEQTVVIARTRVQAVGPTGQVRLPPGTRVVDARGKYVIPGLWDMHAHPMNVTAVYPLLIANGVTGIRDMGNWVPLQTLRRWRHEIAEGRRVGPRMLLAGPSLDSDPHFSAYDTLCYCLISESDAAAQRAQGDTTFVPFPLRVTTPERMRTVADSLHAAGADFLKPHDIHQASIFLAALAEGRRVGLPVAGHTGGVSDSLTPEAIADSGSWGDAHGSLAEGICWSNRAGDSLDEARCAALAARFRRTGTWVTANSMSSPSTVTQREHMARVQYWPRAVTQRAWHTWAARPDSERHSILAYHPEPVAGSRFLAERVGVPLLVGTDFGPLPGFLEIVPGFSLHDELGALVEGEVVTPLGALRAATLNPARAWHATDSLGTVEAGKLADLVLLDANPLVDINNTRRIRAVVANGRYFDRRALDRLLAVARRAGHPGWAQPDAPRLAP